MKNLQYRMIETNPDNIQFDKCGFLTNYYTHGVNESYPAHWHDYFEIEIIIDGAVDYTYNGNNEIATDGKAYLLYIYDNHTLNFLKPTNMITLRFKDSIIRKDLVEFISRHPGMFQCTFERDEIEYIMFLYNKLNLETKNSLQFYSVIAENILTEILIMIIRKNDIKTEEKIPDIIQQVTANIMMNFQKDLSLNLIAEKFSVSPNHLGKIFKKNIGQTFNDYLNKIRLKYACSLLTTSNTPINEIALQSGYNSNEYFLYIFKKYMHIAPSEYRKLYKNQNAIF